MRKIFQSMGTNKFRWRPFTGDSPRLALKERWKFYAPCPGCVGDKDPRKKLKHKFATWCKRGENKGGWGSVRPRRPDPYLLYWRTHRELHERSFNRPKTLLQLRPPPIEDYSIWAISSSS